MTKTINGDLNGLSQIVLLRYWGNVESVYLVGYLLITRS